MSRCDEQLPDPVNAGDHRQNRCVHPRKVVTPRDMHPEVWQIPHELAMPNDGVNRRGDHRLHIRAQGWKDEVSELRNSGADEDETHEEAGERNPTEEPQCSQGVEYGPDEGEYHEERMLAPTDVEEAAHSWSKTSEILLDHVDFKCGDRQQKRREDDFR